MGRAKARKTRLKKTEPTDKTASRLTAQFLAKPLPALVLLLALAFFSNVNVLQNGLGWDDEHIVPELKQSISFWRPLVPFLSESAEKSSHPYFRPMVGVSYQLDFLLWGNDPWGFHLSVLLAHVANTVLSFLLVYLLMGRSPLPYALLPFTTAALFAVHPAHAEAVAWIAGRNDVFCTTFILLSFVLYVLFRQDHNLTFYAGSLVSLYLALLTKELATGIVFLFPVYDFFLLRSKRTQVSEAQNPPSQNPPRYLTFFYWLYTAVPIMMLCAYFWIRTLKTLKPLGGATTHEVALGSWFADAVIAFGFYLKLMAFPFPPKPFIAILPDSLLAIVFSGVATFLLAGITLWTVHRSHILPGVGIGWMGFLIAPAIPVAIFDIAATPLAERYTYAATIGFLMASGWFTFQGLEWLIRTQGFRPDRVWKGAGAVLVLLLIVGILESRERNAVWKDPITFWEAAIAVPPNDAEKKSVAHLKLGLAYRMDRRMKEAISQYETAIRLRPDYALAHNNLANVYQELRDFEKSLEHFEIAIQSDPDYFMPYFNMGHALGRLGQHEEAIKAYRDSIDRNPKFPRAQNNLGNELAGQSRFEEAVMEYESALKIDPDYSKALFNLGVTLIELGRLKEAEKRFNEALLIDPNYAKAYYNLGVISFRTGRYKKARINYNKALSIKKDFKAAKKALTVLSAKEKASASPEN